MPSVKTAISIDAKLFNAADRAARKQGLSRSQFFARAVQHYLERQHGEEITRKLNELFTDDPETAEDKQVRELAARNMGKLIDRW